MGLQDIGICITAIISLLSLLLSLANYQKNKPKLKIEIANKKWDCFFGKTITNSIRPSVSYICGAQINIINNSPVAITITNAHMIVGKESLRLIDNRNKYWETVAFFFKDENGELTTDGSEIYYKENGLTVPIEVNPYDTVTVFVLFHNFPVKISRKCKGTLILNTAIGKIKKKISMIEWDENYQEADYRDYLCYCRSLEEY